MTLCKQTVRPAHHWMGVLTVGLSVWGMLLPLAALSQDLKTPGLDGQRLAANPNCPDEASYQKWLRTKPQDSFSRLGLGLALACHNKLEEAIALYRQLIQTDPTFAAGFDVYSDLGHALRKQGQIDAAIAAYQSAIQHHTDPQSGAYQALSELLRQKGQTAEADAVLQKIPKMDPEGGY
ncbi:MAG: tetratricopeptide repeat protein [Thermosynechococcaceae cyanobacterium]